MGQAKFVGPHKVKYGLPGRVDVGGEVTARDIIIATGSVPFVPPGACRSHARAEHDGAFEKPFVCHPSVAPPCRPCPRGRVGTVHAASMLARS